MIPVVLCANDTSWDHEHDRLIPGGQGDRYLSPILAHLPEAVVSRQPQPGAVNFYMNHRNRYRPECWRGEHASVQGSHGIADKGYRDAAACASFTHVVAPGPALAESIVRSGVARSKVHILGYPKLDPIFQGRVASPWPERDGRIRVLWAPTHGGGSEVHRDGNPNAPGARATTWWRRDELLSLLDPERFLVVEAPHPRHSPGRQATLAQYVGADVVIADGGSTMYEAWCCGLPVVFADWLTAERNLTRAGGALLEHRVYAEKIGWHAVCSQEFPELVEAAAETGITPEEQRFSLEVLPAKYRGVSGKLHADFLLALADGPAHSLHATPPLRREETTLRFFSLKYPNLAVPSVHVRFRPVQTEDGRTIGVADVTTRGAIAHLRSPWMRRRGVLLADEADLTLAGEQGTSGQMEQAEPVEPAPAVPQPGPAAEAEAEVGPVPAGTAGDVLAWVGSDPARARAALAAERQRSKPRTSLLAKLEKLATAVVHDLTPASVIHHQTAEEV